MYGVDIFMFENLTKRLGGIFDTLKKRGFLSEDDIQKAMREIRIALLEADVALPVVKDFITQVKERALGSEVIKSVSPGQMIVKIVQDHLVEVLKSDDSALNLKSATPAVIMMVGLQGSGKTTTSGKLAGFLKKHHKKNVLLVSTDIYRPAAQKQLAVVGNQLQIESLEIIDDQKPKDIAERAMKTARTKGFDVVIFDTAGRLHIDDDLMDELRVLKDVTNPVETLLVADAMTGQDAVNVAKSFHAKLDITGSVLTRIDGDGRGGAALSMRHITQRPIKFLGFGEKLDQLEVFDPDRIAGRILDMGDIVGLVEKAAENLQSKDAEALAKKMEKGIFSLADYQSQLEQMEKMGGISSLMGMMPGFNKMKDKMQENGMDDKVLRRQIAIIQSMTPKERHNPNMLNASRKRRIAKGCGQEVQFINKLLKQFEQTRDVMKRMKKMGKAGLMRQGLGALFGGGR